MDENEKIKIDPRIEKIKADVYNLNNLIASLRRGEHYNMDSNRNILKEEPGNSELVDFVNGQDAVYKQLNADIDTVMKSNEVNLTTDDVNKFYEVVARDLSLNPDKISEDEILWLDNVLSRIKNAYRALKIMGHADGMLGVIGEIK